MKCPDDRLNLTLRDGDETIGYGCKVCDGVFLTQKQIQAFKFNWETNVLDDLFIDGKENKPSNRCCPGCDKDMFLNSVENIVLDTCHQCNGIWFDKMEITHIIDQHGKRPLPTNFLLFLSSLFAIGG